MVSGTAVMEAVESETALMVRKHGGISVLMRIVKLVIDEHYKISEEMPQWVNYTTIQTGVQLAASGVMLIGIALMLASGTMLLMRRRRKA